MLEMNLEQLHPNSGASPMRRLHILSWVGLGLVSVVVLSIGTRPSLRAQDRLGDVLEERIPQSVLLQFVEKPRNVGELKTWLKLQEKVAINFPNDTPLVDVVKYIRQSTIDPNGGFPKGIPIFVDPEALRDVDETLKSMVRLELEDVPLGMSLRLLLKQLRLTYEIKEDGLLIITTNSCGDGEPISYEEANWRTFELLRDEVRDLRAEIRSLRRSEGVSRPMGGPANAVPPVNGTTGGMGGGFR